MGIKKKPRHCFIGYDYVEDKCKNIECRFNELCKKINKQLKGNKGVCKSNCLSKSVKGQHEAKEADY